MSLFESVIQQNNEHTQTKKVGLSYMVLGPIRTPCGCCNYKIGSASGRESFPVTPPLNPSAILMIFMNENRGQKRCSAFVYLWIGSMLGSTRLFLYRLWPVSHFIQWKISCSISENRKSGT